MAFLVCKIRKGLIKKELELLKNMNVYFNFILIGSH